MIDIAIEYPFLLFRRKVKSKAPTSWDELTERQFLAISRAVDGAIPDYRFLSILSGIKEKLLRKLTPFSLFKLSEGIEFVGTAGNVHSNFIIREIRGTDFISPKPKLDSLTFGQFIFADAYYSNWMGTKDEKQLNNLVATLYLLPGEKFSSDTIVDRIWTLANVDSDIRKAIAFNYGLILMWLQKCYPLIFRETDNSNADRRDAINRVSTSRSGWLTLFESMVADDLINRDRYAELPIHTVLRHLTSKYKENARRG